MPGPSQYALSRRALLVGGVAILAGCSADDPHDGDPDAATVTPAPVPMTGPERLAAIERSDLPAFEPPLLVTDEHLAARLDTVEAHVQDVEALLEETPTAVELVGSSGGATGTETTTTGPDDERDDGRGGEQNDGRGDERDDDRLDQIERVRRQARETVSEARQFLEDERERDGQPSERPGYRTENDVYLNRANHRVERLSVSYWMLRVAYDRTPVDELPEPTDVEARLRELRDSIAYRCDGSGLGMFYLSAVEQPLRAAFESIADFEERAEGRSGAGSDDDGDTGTARSTTTADGQAAEVPIRRVHETVSVHARARVRLFDARQYLSSYEARMGDAVRCGDRLESTVDELRSETAEWYGWLGDHLPDRERTERPTDDSGDGTPPLRLVPPVRRRFALPEEYHERRLSRIDDLEQDGWVALPCRDLAQLLLWYRAIATAVELLPDGPVDPSERLELVTTTHERAVERFTAAVDASRDDPLARRYLRYGASALDMAEETLTSLDADAIDTHDGHQQLVRAYTLLLQAIGASANAEPVSRTVRGA